MAETLQRTQNLKEGQQGMKPDPYLAFTQFGENFSIHQLYKRNQLCPLTIGQVQFQPLLDNKVLNTFTSYLQIRQRQKCQLSPNGKYCTTAKAPPLGLGRFMKENLEDQDQDQIKSLTTRGERSFHKKKTLTTCINGSIRVENY